MLVFYLGASIFVYRASAFMTASTAAGNIAMGFLAVSPASIHGSLEPLTLAPAAMCVSIIAYSLIRLESGESIGNVLLLASSAAYLALIRPSGLLLLGALPVYLLWRTRKWMPGLAVCAVAVLVVGSWIGYVYEKTGRVVKINTANSANFYLGNNAYTPVYRTWWLGSHHSPPEVPAAFAEERDRIMELDVAAQESEFSRIASEHIRQHPELFLLRTLNRICTYFAFDTFAGAYLIGNYGLAKPLGLVVIAADALVYILIAVGSILYFALPRSKEASMTSFALLGLALLYALPYFFAFAHPNHHYPIDPILMILSSGFFVHILNGKGAALQSFIQHRTIPMIMALVAFVFIQVEFFSIVMLHRV
jgi:hypothetical protein